MEHVETCAALGGHSNKQDRPRRGTQVGGDATSPRDTLGAWAAATGRELCWECEYWHWVKKGSGRFPLRTDVYAFGHPEAHVGGGGQGRHLGRRDPGTGGGDWWCSAPRAPARPKRPQMEDAGARFLGMEAREESEEP
jgi:hypothetical protein